MQYIKKVMSIVVFSLLIVLSFSCNVFADEGISIEVKAGYNGTYKIGGYAPVNIQIINNERDIDGEIQLGIRNDNGNTTLFSKEINLPMNSTKNVTINMPLTNVSSKIYVKLIEDKRVYYEDFKTINAGIYQDSILIGILSDEQDNVSYAGDIGNINFQNKNNAQSKAVQLDENIFPEKNNVMESFDILVINDFDTSKLNEKQYSVLKTWVNNGGTLIIGTGLAYNKTLGIFKDNYLVGEIGEVKRVNTSALHKFIDVDKNAKEMEIDLLDLELEKGIQVLEYNESSIIQKIDKGKGIVAVLAFDLGLNPVANWDSRHSFMERLISEVSSKNFSMQPEEKHDKFRGIQNKLTNIPELPMPTATKTIIIFMIYILLVSPVSYIILKKRDKRELMWGIVPLLSMIFIVIMFVSGISTRVTTSVINSVNYIKVDKEGNKSIDSFGSILTPTKTDIRIYTEENMELTPMLDNNYDHYSSSGNNTNLKVSDVNVTSKIMLGNTDYIEYYSNTVFSNNSIRINNIPPEGNAVCSLNYADGMYIGKVTNEFDFDLIDSYVLFNNSYIKIGDIKTGETKEIKASSNTYSGDIYDFTEKTYNKRINSPTAAFMSSNEMKAIKLGRQKADLLNTYFQDMNAIDSPKLISWASTDVNKGILINGKSIRKFEKSIIITEANVTFINGGIAEYPYGFISPKIDTSGNNNGGYDEYSKRFYGTGNFEISFPIDRYDINPNEINIKYNITITAPGGDKAVEQFIYNYKIDEWEEGDFRNYKILQEDFDKYLDSNNILKFKLNILKDDISGEIPKISVKGSAK